MLWPWQKTRQAINQLTVAVCRLRDELREGFANMENILDALEAEVAKVEGIEDSAVALIEGIAQQLKDALAANDPHEDPSGHRLARRQGRDARGRRRRQHAGPGRAAAGRTARLAPPTAGFPPFPAAPPTRPAPAETRGGAFSRLEESQVLGSGSV